MRHALKNEKRTEYPSFDNLVNPSHEGEGDSAGAEVDTDGWTDGGDVTSFGLYYGFRICQQFRSYIRRVGVGGTQVNWCPSVNLLDKDFDQAVEGFLAGAYLFNPFKNAIPDFENRIELEGSTDEFRSSPDPSPFV